VSVSCGTGPWATDPVTQIFIPHIVYALGACTDSERIVDVLCKIQNS